MQAYVILYSINRVLINSNKVIDPCKTYESNVPKGFRIFLTIKDCIDFIPKKDIKDYSILEINTIGDVDSEPVVDSNNKNIGTCYYTHEMRTGKLVSLFEIMEYLNEGTGNTDCDNKGNMNSGTGNHGHRNSGSYNKGNENSGNNNKGHKNAGSMNEGNENHGSYNRGNFNSGSDNLGDKNSGNNNCGNENSGDNNKGDENIGDQNLGNGNSGYCNTGDFNSGSYNTGSYNTGNYNRGVNNSGDCNTGDNNCGDYNTTDNSNGAFNTEEPKIYLFNKQSDWTLTQFRESRAYWLLKNYLEVPKNIGLMRVYSKCLGDMTSAEEKAYPESAVTRCCLVKTALKPDLSPQEQWNGLSKADKNHILSLPNFDADIFLKMTGIDVNAKKKRSASKTDSKSTEKSSDKKPAGKTAKKGTDS